MKPLIVGLAWLLVGLFVLLLLLYWQQRRLIYLPLDGTPPAAATMIAGAEEISFVSGDGLELAGWFVPAAKPGGGAVLVCNGNAGNRGGRVALAAGWSGRGYSVLLFDYRGFGGNPGSPNEQGLLRDARAARSYLERRPEVDPAQVVLFGESLGAAVALALAVERPPSALVLRSPFTSLAEVGRLHYPLLPVSLLLRDRFPSNARIAGLTCPLFVVAGEADRIVPQSQSKALFDLAPVPYKRFVTIHGAGHNDAALGAGDQMLDAIDGFLDEIRRASSAVEAG